MRDLGRPLLLLDFDDVLNFDASRNAFRKFPDNAGHWRQRYLAPEGMGLRVRWSTGAVSELNRQRSAYGFEWQWLTSWRQYAVSHIDPALHTHSDGYVDWKESDGQGYERGTADPNSAAKWAHVLRLNDEDPRPFVWVDDTAVTLFDPSMLRSDVPHLIVQTDPMWGLTNSDLDRMDDFWKSLG